MSPDDRCGECGHIRNCHSRGLPCIAERNCSCSGFREHAPEDFPPDNRLKIAALCGVLDFQLDSVRFELDRADCSRGKAVREYIDSVETTLTELRKLALARE